MKAKVIIGANLGDEGKGTVVANYVKHSKNVLNVLTNGGAQRAHSILTDKGSFTFQHFGSGSFFGADNYFCKFYILNPLQFVKEYNELIDRDVKLKKIYRHPDCRWSTPYDMMANQIIEELRSDRKHGSCGMGIWETVKRFNNHIYSVTFDEFVSLEHFQKLNLLKSIRDYFDKTLKSYLNDKWKNIWYSDYLMEHFISDCQFLYDNTIIMIKPDSYENLIFENGQGLLLNDTGADIAGTTPSKTDSSIALSLLKQWNVENSDITLHYVTRPYMTRHGKGILVNEDDKNNISNNIQDDRTNHYNQFQNDFRFGNLDIQKLKERIDKDNIYSLNSILEVTHCDEMDREQEFKKVFNNINLTDSPLIK